MIQGDMLRSSRTVGWWGHRFRTKSGERRKEMDGESVRKKKEENLREFRRGRL